ncbi:unnamed protein product [Amoebophrya sp. A25]|nr:unnamed protein product [Amoebophrya sp. A25]|eukprot:GSA25T00017219001.1
MSALRAMFDLILNFCSVGNLLQNSAAAAAGGASTVLKKPQELPWWDNVNLDGKPQQYCTRMIGECKRIFCVPQTDMRWEKPVLWDLSRFEVVYETKGMDKDSKLRKDCEEQNLEGIRFEVNIPEKFPMVPPMVRVLHPKIQGGFVFRSGAICFELLTPKGWVTTMGLPSVAVALIGLFADPTHPARVEKVGKDLRTIPDYTREAAEKEVQHIIKAHDGGSSWGQKIKDMKS